MRKKVDKELDLLIQKHGIAAWLVLDPKSQAQTPGAK